MLAFVTTNPGKVAEAREYLDDVEQLAYDYTEVQGEDLGTVAAHGAREAYRATGQPVLVDDSGLFVEAFDGFPGPYSSYVEDRLGIDRVWRLTEPEETHAARFETVLAYCDGEPFDASPAPVDRGDGDASTGDGAGTTSVERGHDVAASERDSATAADQVRGGGAAGTLAENAAGESGGASGDADALPVRLFVGTVHGTIVPPRGDGGFGYDPIFEHDGRTFAELDADEKNAVSHRGRALARFAEWAAETGRLE